MNIFFHRSDKLQVTGLCTIEVAERHKNRRTA